MAADPEVAAACTTALLGTGADVKELRDRIGSRIVSRISAALGEQDDASVLQTLNLAYVGAMLSAGMGHLTFAEVPDAMATRGGSRAGDFRARDCRVTAMTTHATIVERVLRVTTSCPASARIPIARPAVVTGASSGIGAATARALAAAGHPVVLGARRLERLNEITREIVSDGGEAVAVKLDLANGESIEAFVRRSRYGRSGTSRSWCPTRDRLLRSPLSMPSRRTSERPWRSTCWPPTTSLGSSHGRWSSAVAVTWSS